MPDITFQAPRIIEIGGGAVAKAAALLARLGLAKPLIVTDPSVNAAASDTFTSIVPRTSKVPEPGDEPHA